MNVDGGFILAEEVFAAVIGGSGFYDLLKETRVIEIDTPFGLVTCHVGSYYDIPIAFIPRHGETHSIPPHRINFRANMWAIYSMGAKWIISTNAVGAVDPNLRLGSIVLVNDFLDLWSSPITYFDGDPSFSVIVNGKELRGVVHVDMTEPYCRKIRNYVKKAADHLDLPLDVVPEGIYANTKGPRFETPAEIRALRMLGADVVGMTSAREATLSRELGLCYASLSIVTNKAAGMQEKVTVKEVFELFDSVIPDVKKVILTAIENLKKNDEKPCQLYY